MARVGVRVGVNVRVRVKVRGSVKVRGRVKVRVKVRGRGRVFCGEAGAADADAEAAPLHGHNARRDEQLVHLARGDN